MKVVFLEDVAGVARGGDVKEVKNGFARNYLIPKSLAVPATHNAMQGVKKLADVAEKTRLKRLKDMKALSEELTGVRVNVEMRAGTGGRLYGSVTNAIIASKLSEITGRQLDRRTVTLPESVRELGIYDASIRLHTDVEAEIQILVYPLGSEPEEYLAELEGASEEEASDTDGEESPEEETPDGAETAEAEATDEEPVAEVTEAAVEATPEPESAEPEAESAEAELAAEEPVAETTDVDSGTEDSQVEAATATGEPEATAESDEAADTDESGS